MTTNDIPDGYMHCFDVNDKIPRYEPMEVEQQIGDLAETMNLEWHYWKNSEPSEKSKSNRSQT